MGRTNAPASAAASPLDLLRKNRRTLVGALGIALSALAIVGLVRAVPTGDTLARLAEARLPDLGLALLAYVVTFVFKVVRWRLLLGRGYKRSSLQLAEALAIGFATNAIVPTKLGEVARIVMTTGPEGVPASRATLAIVVERLCDLGALALLIVALGLRLALPDWLIRPAQVTGALVLLAIGALVLVGVAEVGPTGFRAWLRQLAKRVAAFSPLRAETSSWIRVQVVAVAQALRELRSVQTLASLALLTGLVWASTVAFNYAILLAFVASPTLLAAALLAGAGAASNAIPSAPSGLGVTQYAIVLALGLVAIAPDRALAASIAVAILSFVPVSIVGLLLLWRRGFVLAVGQGATDG